MMRAGSWRTEMYEVLLQPSRTAVPKGACKTRENERAKGGEGNRSAKIQSKNSTALFKTSGGVERWVLLSGADRAPLSEGGRDARGRERRRGVTEGTGSCRDGDTPVSLTCSRWELPHGPTAGTPHVGMRRPPVRAGKRLGRPSPATPPTSRSREIRFSELSPPLREVRPDPVAALPKTEGGPPPLQAPQGRRVWGEPSRHRGTGRGSLRRPRGTENGHVPICPVPSGQE
ncbi:unnamed protein product [Coccothraustes coccothraustes]